MFVSSKVIEPRKLEDISLFINIYKLAYFRISNISSIRNLHNGIFIRADLFTFQHFIYFVIYSTFARLSLTTVFKMDSNHQVSSAKSVGLISWILKIIAFPFTLGNFIYTFLMSKKLKNCLPGKVVLITGASSGLGEALAHTFYVAGCKVVLAARRQDELERVRKELLQLHSVSKSR